MPGTTGKTIDLSSGRRRILRVALAHWANALKRVSSRVQGMGYHRTAASMRIDRELIEGDDANQGLLERLNPQGNLLEDEAELPTEGGVPLNHDELRLSYYAVKKHRERILDLKRKNEKEEYETEEQEADLDMIGEPAGPDGESSSGFLAELDLGWETADPDPLQMDLTETTGGGGSSPDSPEPSVSPEAEQAAEENGDLEEFVLRYCRRRLEENPDLPNKDLHEECVVEFPNAGLDDLTLRQFHARYPLQVKRAMAQESS